ncbi:MAG: cytochrome [Glaciihabitans sp.]|nr:cytochrome [Glaciihabitans sp.]
MVDSTTFAEILKPENRAAPNELWAQLREEPVSRQDDGTWVVTGYNEVRALAADPRISADFRTGMSAEELAAVGAPGEGGSVGGNFVVEDPPAHDRDRAKAMKHFGPPHRPGFVASLEGAIQRYVDTSLDRLRGQEQMDVVADFSYPLPVRVICDVLGVPPEDEPQFSLWTTAISLQASPDLRDDPVASQQADVASQQAAAYMYGLIQRRKVDPGNDMISDMVSDTSEDRLTDQQIISNAIILLIAGHETTVNAVSSGILLLLRNPETAELLRERPELMPGAFEEILRLEPPVQFRDRRTLSDIDIAGVTIPRFATVQLSYAAANRDPNRFADPDRFDPEREDNQHLSFNTGLHYCFGAPLARLEGILALRTWLRRVQNPRLLVDPPPYRRSPALRGPSELLVGFDEIL